MFEWCPLIVSFSDTNGWERVFTLYLKLFLDWNFPGNTIPPAVFWKKRAQSAFSGGASILGGSKFVFQYLVAYFGNFVVHLYVFSHAKLIAIIFKIQNGCRVPENSKWRLKWHFETKWEYDTVYYQLLWLKCLFWRFWVQRIYFRHFQNSKWPSHTRKSKMAAKIKHNLAKV